MLASSSFKRKSPDAPDLMDGHWEVQFSPKHRHGRVVKLDPETAQVCAYLAPTPLLEPTEADDGQPYLDHSNRYSQKGVVITDACFMDPGRRFWHPSVFVPTGTEVVDGRIAVHGKWSALAVVTPGIDLWDIPDDQAMPVFRVSFAAFQNRRLIPRRSGRNGHCWDIQECEPWAVDSLCTYNSADGTMELTKLPGLVFRE